MKELTRNKLADPRMISSPQVINPFKRFFVSALSARSMRNAVDKL